MRESSTTMIDNSKQAVGVLFTSAAKINGTVPFKKRNSSRVWTLFSAKAKKYGLNIFFAHHTQYKDGKLMKCWYKENDRWKIARNQEVDVIYSRFAGSIYKDNNVNKAAQRFKLNMAKQVTIINHPALDEFCWDKRIVADAFPMYSPKTFVVNTPRGLKLVLGRINSDKVVIKPRYGTLGKDVLIVDKDNLPKKIGKNTLVQEFIDTSKGIKRITDEIHDMRIIMINGKIDHVHIRTPKKGTLTANVALGGTKVFIPNSKIPKKAITIAK
ncbi:MAG: hypothetical protein V3V78_02375, partial [Candidatus Woesearchaeota archaeon]